jgi:hypothetical protein
MRTLPPRTRGPLGSRDAGDPDVCAEPGDTPGTLGVRDGAEHISHGRAPQLPHRPGNREGNTTPSILDIPAGRPRATYPRTLSVPDFLVGLVRNLQKDNKVPNKGSEVVIERAGIISKTGVLFPLSKEEHIGILGNGDRNRGLLESQGTSPNREKTLNALLRQERDPTVLLGAIYVHTHPGFSAPSPPDIFLTAHRFRSVFLPSKSLVVGEKYIFLMVPTSETWSIKPADIMPMVTNAQTSSPVNRRAIDPDEMEQGTIASAAAEARAVHVQFYEYTDADKVFHRQ